MCLVLYAEANNEIVWSNQAFDWSELTKGLFIEDIDDLTWQLKNKYGVEKIHYSFWDTNDPDDVEEFDM